MKNIDQVYDHVWWQVKSQASNKVYDQASGQIWFQVSSMARTQVSWQVERQVRDSVIEELE